MVCKASVPARNRAIGTGWRDGSFLRHAYVHNISTATNWYEGCWSTACVRPFAWKGMISFQIIFHIKWYRMRIHFHHVSTLTVCNIGIFVNRKNVIWWLDWNQEQSLVDLIGTRCSLRSGSNERVGSLFTIVGIPILQK